MKEKFSTTNCLSPADVKKLRTKGENVTIIDVRSPEEFNERHIPEAVNIPLDALEKFVSLFDRNLIFITACGKGGGRSAQGGEMLRQAGFRSTWLCGGTFGWFEEN
jgi:rhodanese-related sulfurtransferase